jgi:hypothetical protein
MLGVSDVRRYQRYTVSNDLNTPVQFEVTLEGKAVCLVNFSVGDFYVLSKVPFSPGLVTLSVKFKNRGEIAMPGNIVRVTQEGDMWGIAIDLSKTYEQLSIQKVK